MLHYTLNKLFNDMSHTVSSIIYGLCFLSNGVKLLVRFKTDGCGNIMVKRQCGLKRKVNPVIIKYKLIIEKIYN